MTENSTTENNQSKKQPSGRGKTGMNSGRVLDYLREVYRQKPNFKESTSVLWRADFYANGWNAYTPRSILTPDQVVTVFHENPDLTLHQLFINALGIPDLSPEKKEVLSILESLPAADLSAFIEVVRSLQNPWWVPLLSEPIPEIGKRLAEITRRRLGYVSADRDSSKKFEITPTYFPFSKTKFIEFDDLPKFADELDVSYPILTELGYTVPNYTRNAFADAAFCEFGMLSSSLKPIAVEFSYCLKTRREDR